MRFTPAGYWIGAGGIWSYSLMWEHGKNKDPVEFLHDRGIVKKESQVGRGWYQAVVKVRPNEDIEQFKRVCIVHHPRNQDSRRTPFPVSAAGGE